MTGIELRRADVTLVGTRTGAGPGVVLLHAGGERRAVWRPIADRLAGAGYRCDAYDLRGHGESGTAGRDDLANHAGDVAAMLAAQARPVTVVGASLGGLAALLALGEGEVVRGVAGLVLVDVVPRLDPGRVRSYLDGVRAGYGDDPLVVDVLDQRARVEAAVDDLCELSTLLVRGGGRSPLTDDDCRWFTERVPHAGVVTVRGAGHLVARDAPASLAEALLDQLGPHRPGRRPAACGPGERG